MSVSFEISSHSTSQPFTDWQVITSDEEFSRLQIEWDSLWNDVENAAIFQSFKYCWFSWIYMAKPAKHSLFCIVLRNEGKMVGIWPLVIHRKLALKIIRPLGLCVAEYTDPLVQQTESSKAIVSFLMDIVKEKSHCDIVNLPFVKVELDLFDVVVRDNPWNMDADFAPHVVWKGQTTWDDYYNSLSKSYLKVQSKKKRQLNSLGDVVFEAVTDRTRYPEIISWLMSEKRKWCGRVDKLGDWVVLDDYKRCITALAIDPSPTNQIIIYVLKLDNKIIAAQYAAVNRSHIDWLIAAFDSDLAKFSPGIVLNEYCLRWAFERKLNCDFGVGMEENKTFFSKRQYSETRTIQITNSLKGRIACEVWRAKRQASNRYKVYKLRKANKNRILVS